MLPYILVAVAVVIVAFIAFVASRPSEFVVERSTTIAAPAPVVFGYVNDLHKWEAWSPWAKLDPAMKQTFDGPPAGVGAMSAWVGNSKVGQGRMTITGSRPGELVQLRLEFLKPFRCTNTAEFTFKPEGAQTAVTWAMMGRNNFFLKGMCLFMNMDKMLGKDFEKGLAQMKLAAEAASHP